MTYTQKAAAVEAFLTGRAIPEGDVLSLDIAKTHVRLHLYGPLLTGMTWDAREHTPGHVHNYASVVQDGVPIDLVIVTMAEEVAA